MYALSDDRVMVWLAMCRNDNVAPATLLDVDILAHLDKPVIGTLACTMFSVEFRGISMSPFYWISLTCLKIAVKHVHSLKKFVILLTKKF